MIFTLNPILGMSQTFFIQQNITIFIMTTTFLFMPLTFYAHYYHLPNPDIFLASI